ncbi:porin family protein [Dyadobacter pollutisoli]|uniref:Porin family protein n=1 Tax=Dyadobacter pollutisoli TaxID=2910158 RepID=A0A9E8NDY5_9BACT|nr:porin family protein [Dyadobacter pollutisoli]WAC12399.1 porin family protein [Dyadobacter pollutisoli]
MVKKFIGIVCVVLFCDGFPGSAQVLRFGIKTGLNGSLIVGENYFSAHNYKIRYPSKTLFYHAGLTSDVRLSKTLSVQPEILYSTAGYDWFSREEEFNGSNSTTEPDVSESLASINIPLLLRVKVGGLGLVVGPQVSRLVSAKRNAFVKGNTDVKSDYLMGNTLSGVAGLEYTFWFGLGFHARYSYAFRSVAKITEKGIYAEGNSLYNHAAMGGIHFYFNSKKQ